MALKVQRPILIKRRRLERLDKEYGEHVREIKKRATFCVGCFLLALCFGIANADKIICISLGFAQGAGFEIISVSPGDTVVAGISLVIRVAILLSIPFAAYQCLGFIVPALASTSVFRVRVALLFMIILFYSGVVFSFYIMLPIFFRFISVYGDRFSVTRFFAVSEYMSFICTFSVCMGLAFETPVFVGTLWGIGVIDQSRIKKFRKLFYLLIFVGAAVITPPDVISQIMVALPMLVLFEIGNVCGLHVSRKRTGMGKIKKKTA